MANDPKTPDIDGWQYDSLSGQIIAAIVKPFADQSAHTIKIQLADRLGNFVVRETSFKIENTFDAHQNQENTKLIGKNTIKIY